MATKLTLRMDEELVREAKAYANAHNVSVSRLVADFFAALEASEADGGEAWSPLVRELHGCLRGADSDEADYRRYLQAKYQ